MPYKLNAAGDTVMVQRNGKWEVLKKHKTHAEALDHLQAMLAIPKKKLK